MMEPKIRLKGYSGEWIVETFSECFEPLKNNSLSRAELSDSGEVKNVHYGDVLIKFGECIDTQKDRLPFILDNEISKHLYNISPLQKGDIIFADAAEDNTVGKCSEIVCKEGEAIVSGLHTIACRPKNEYAERYLGYYLNSPSFHNQLLPHIQGTKISSISRKAINTTSVHCPIDKKEQISLASFFSNLDILITVSVSKLECLKQIKVASLQAMFPQGGESIPKLRFNGFEGEWKKVCLNECLSVCKDKNTDNTYTKEDVLSVSDDYGILKKGDIVYTKSPLKAKPYGIIKTNHCKTGIVSTLYAIYSPKEGTCADFIEVYFDLPERLNKYIHPLVNKGAKNDMKVSSENALKGRIMIPSYEEQTKIADYFASLDRLITIQSHRLEKLRKIKAACLDEMFI